MKRYLLVAFGLIAVLTLILVVAFAIRGAKKPEPAEPPAPVVFPVEQVTELGDDPSIRLTLQNGSTVQVPQFLSDEQSETAGAQNGLDVSYGASDLYQILYFPDESYFLISILKEPLKDARLAAEAELRAKLRLQDPALCQLVLDVFVASDVSEIYSGRDLGLSFCPDGVQLP